jgi:hypothetical protein
LQAFDIQADKNFPSGIDAQLLHKQGRHVAHSKLLLQMHVSMQHAKKQILIWDAHCKFKSPMSTTDIVIQNDKADPFTL